MSALQQLIQQARNSQQAGDWVAAESHLRQVLRIDPAHAEALTQLGVLAAQQKRLHEAESHLRRAVCQAPQASNPLFHLANLLADADRLDEAIACYLQLLEIAPRSVAGWFNLGRTLQDAGRFEEATECYTTALLLEPRFSDARLNRGISLRCLGRLDESQRCFTELLQHNPEDAQAHLQRGLTALSAGNWADGWEEYEWRWRAEAEPRQLPLPLWNGEKSPQQKVLVLSEQGIGDEVMFASCLPDLLERVGQCVVECESRLVPLFARSFPRAKVVAAEIDPASPSFPPCDSYLPIGSLPRFFRRSEDAFPRQQSFLQADEAAVSRWRTRFDEELGAGWRIGISWRGGRKPEIRRSRSTPLSQWRPVFGIPGVQFVNLQYGETADEREQLAGETGVLIHDWPEGNPLLDLDSFAARLKALDLVISVDNSTVHLAGALGVPTWVLLPFAADFRWQHRRKTTPWYPSVRLFRQPSPGDWASVLREVAALLEKKHAGAALPERKTAG